MSEEEVVKAFNKEVRILILLSFDVFLAVYLERSQKCFAKTEGCGHYQGGDECFKVL